MSTPSRPGLAAERTRLAWRRTTLAGVVVVLIATSRAMIGGLTPLEMAAVALMSLLWLASIAVAYRRITALSDDRHPQREGPDRFPPPGRAPALLALVITGIAVLGLALVTHR